MIQKEYLSGKLSVLRNRDLAYVFYRLGFVEIFGTGIIRIKQLYELALVKPDFEVKLTPEQEANLEILDENTDPQIRKSLELLKTK